MDEYSLVFKALGDETRLKIVHLLVSNDYCVGGLAKALGITDSAVSQHLKVLKEAGLVEGKKVGYYTHYSVKRERLNLVINEIKKW
jgi:DNA-binding transcriptional ArsR family regulator